MSGDSQPAAGGSEGPGGDAPEEAEEGESTLLKGSERTLFWWFCGLLGVNVAGIVWLAVRSESPLYLRGVLDFLLQGATGALVVYFAFRALFLYPFHMLDLLAMVVVLSLGLGATEAVLSTLANTGLIHSAAEEASHWASLCQAGLFTSSILVAGASLGLRHCTLLKLDRSLVRVVAVVSGMLALPAAAGIAAFLVPVFRELKEAPEHALAWLLVWLLSLAVTGINSVLFIKTLTLREEITAREKLAE